MEEHILGKLLQMGGLGPIRQAERKHQPTEAFMAFIPSRLNDKVVTLTSNDLNMEKNIKTVFIGIVTQEYTSTMWDTDVKKWTEHFELEPQNIIHLKMQELLDLKGVLDTARAIVEIQKVLTMINLVPCGLSIRLICIGPGRTNMDVQAITYLIKEWKTPENKPRSAEHKVLQIVTSGDSKECNLFDLSKRLCLAGVCKSIEFYNTMNYHPFGHYNKAYFMK